LRNFQMVSKVNQPVVLLNDLRYPKNHNDDYFKAISRTPDKKFYLDFDLLDVDDGEQNKHDLYPIKDFPHTGWDSSLINRIKFEMPYQVPLYNWDTMDKVI
jgi:hypothetical protein